MCGAVCLWVSLCFLLCCCLVSGIYIDHFVLQSQRSTVALAKDNSRLQTAYNETMKAGERELSQMKSQYEANLAALGKSLELTQASTEQKIAEMEDGHDTYKNFTKAAIRGANQLRREQEEKIASLDATVNETKETLRRREGILKCQLDVAHENTDRVLLEMDELQSTVDRLTREKRTLERDLKEGSESFDRAQKLCADLEDELAAAQSTIEKQAAQHQAELRMFRAEAENVVEAEQTKSKSMLKGEQQATELQLESLRTELETRAMLEADEASKKLEDAEQRYMDAQKMITDLEGQLVQLKETHEIKEHESAMKIAQLQGEADTANLHVSRVDAEKIALEQKLSVTRESALKVQQELETLLDDAERHIEQLKAEVSIQQKTNDDMHEKFTTESEALREAVASAQRAEADANYNLEATAKRLGDVVNDERTAHARTRNEAEQVQLRLRRDLQAAREAAEKYHKDKVVADMKTKLEKERARTVRGEMHRALQAVDIMSQERDLAEQRAEEIEWSTEQRCNKLVSDKLAVATKAKEDLAKQNVARKFAEDQANVAADRARIAEEELVDLQSSLNDALGKTRALEQEKSEALSMLGSAQERARKMEEDQQTLIGYADAVASHRESPSPMKGSLNLDYHY